MGEVLQGADQIGLPRLLVAKVVEHVPQLAKRSSEGALHLVDLVHHRLLVVGLPLEVLEVHERGGQLLDDLVVQLPRQLRPHQLVGGQLRDVCHPLDFWVGDG